ncbi:MAG: zinc-ribbon domain-containing protein [Pseudomonadota bacterium]
MTDSPRMRVPRWAPPLLTLTVAIVVGNLYGVQLVVLTLAAGALLLVIWLLWNSVQALAGESELTFEEAFSLGARSAEEEQKRAVLRALKDLEYERSVGKIGEDDFHEYSARYRAEAKRLMQTLDENLAEGRQQVERELERRLARAGAKSAEALEASDEAEANTARLAPLEAGAELEEPGINAGHSPAPGGLQCSACQAKNEPDARFCKACGTPLLATVEGSP